MVDKSGVFGSFILPDPYPACTNGEVYLDGEVLLEQMHHVTVTTTFPRRKVSSPATNILYTLTTLNPTIAASALN